MDLISKKDLLAATGISYGQLYRWKREGLIPEAWFIKRSSYTGQETFFPREQILSRVHTILDAKGQYSLEELAALFSPEGSQRQWTADGLAQFPQISPALLPLLPALWGKETYTFFDAVLLAGVSQAAGSLGWTGDRLRALLACAVSAAGAMPKTTDCTLVIFQALDVCHAVLTKSGVPLWFDTQCDVLASCDLGELATQLKLNDRAQA